MASDSIFCRILVLSRLERLYPMTTESGVSKGRDPVAAHMDRKATR